MLRWSRWQQPTGSGRRERSDVGLRSGAGQPRGGALAPDGRGGALAASFIMPRE